MTALDEAYNKYPEAANNVIYREILKKSIFSSGASYFVGLSKLSVKGTSSILGMNSHNSPLPLGFAVVSMVLDTCAASSHLLPGTFDERDASTFLRNLDIINGCQRSLVKYFVKHTPCSCLDEMYSKIKTSPKMGVCANCKQRKERKKMFICTGCKRAQYCCKVCQLADYMIIKVNARGYKRVTFTLTLLIDEAESLQKLQWGIHRHTNSHYWRGVVISHGPYILCSRIDSSSLS